MKERTRNLMVGLTVIVALIVFAVMALIFQELPSFLQFGHRLELRFPNSAGAARGTDVLLSGVRIGRLSDIRFTENDPRNGVTLTVTIGEGIKIPANVNAYIRPRGLGTGAMIELKADGPPRIDPATGQPMAFLPAEKTTVIQGYLGDSGLIPADMAAELRGTMTSFRTLADRVNALLAPPATEPAATTLAATPTPTTTPAGTPPAAPNLGRTMAKLDTALDAVNKVIGDPENQANLKATLTNLKTASATANDVLGEVKTMMADVKGLMANANGTFTDVSAFTKSAAKQFDTLSTKLVDDADKLGQGLTQLNQAIAAINEGKGTAGKLLNDPRLYNDLLDTTSQVQKTLGSLQALLESWKQQGIKLNLK